MVAKPEIGGGRRRLVFRARSLQTTCFCPLNACWHRPGPISPRSTHLPATTSRTFPTHRPSRARSKAHQRHRLASIVPRRPISKHAAAAAFADARGTTAAGAAADSRRRGQYAPATTSADSTITATPPAPRRLAPRRPAALGGRGGGRGRGRRPAAGGGIPSLPLHARGPDPPASARAAGRAAGKAASCIHIV